MDLLATTILNARFEISCSRGHRSFQQVKRTFVLLRTLASDGGLPSRLCGLAGQPPA